MTILDNIIRHKKTEVAKQKKLCPYSYLEKSSFFKNPNNSLVKRLRTSKSGIIAEYKKRSPSKPEINSSASITEVTKGYETAGVCGISILTDRKYFGGSLKDLNLARKTTKLPVLRKDFIIDVYQIVEAKANGADLILLIASVLTKKQIKVFSDFAKSLGLEVLLEIHSLDELEESIVPSVDIVGVNNRNLKSFKVNLNTSRELSDKIPKDFVKISESGIDKASSVINLKDFGYQGFLVGENFMKTDNPGKSAREFIKNIEDEV